MRYFILLALLIACEPSIGHTHYGPERTGTVIGIVDETHWLNTTVYFIERDDNGMIEQAEYSYKERPAFMLDRVKFKGRFYHEHVDPDAKHEWTDYNKHHKITARLK